MRLRLIRDIRNIRPSLNDIMNELRAPQYLIEIEEKFTIYRYFIDVFKIISNVT